MKNTGEAHAKSQGGVGSSQNKYWKGDSKVGNTENLEATLYSGNMGAGTDFSISRI